MNEKSKSHSMEGIHSFFSLFVKKETHEGLPNNHRIHLLLPLVLIHFSLIILSNPSPPSFALQDHEQNYV